MKNKYRKIRIIFTLISVIIGFLLPIILYLTGKGYIPSFSEYHYTEASPYLFISLIAMGLGFFTGKYLYWISGILLIGIAFINLDYQLVHNILAFSFFFYTAILIFTDKRFYLLSLPIFYLSLTIPFGGLYIFEVISVLCITIFNTCYLLRFLRIINIK